MAERTFTSRNKSTAKQKKPAVSQNEPAEKTIAEIKAFEQKQKLLAERFAAVKNAVQLIDLTKTQSRTFSTFSKATLRTYMRNPKSNESNLRNLSRFLYRMSHAYRRLISYRSEMVDLTAISVIPLIDLNEEPDTEQVLSLYYNTLLQLEKMSMHSEIHKCLLTAWKEDCFFGYTYEDDTGFFIYPLDGDYCQISSVNYDGTYNFAFDFSYFRSHASELEYWDKEFNSKYNSYLSDNKLRWQELDPERTMCLKVNAEDLTLTMPPLVTLFEPLIDLIDLQSIQAVKDDLSIYKLLVARVETRANADDPDEFTVDIDTAIEYYNRLAESLPDCVSSAISPLKIEPIEFKDDQTEDVNRISTATSNLYKTAGGSQILDNESTGTTITEAKILSDTMEALRPLLSQIEKWVNRYLSYVLGDHAKVKYLEVSPYTKDLKKKSLLESGQNGVPIKLEVAALDGFSPLETMSKDFLENKVLDLSGWTPFITSYTQSGDGTDPIDGGAPTKDSDELTDDGEASREKSDNKT